MNKTETSSLEAANDTAGPDVESILQEIRALRGRIVIAWHERAVVLSREEQRALRCEIKNTCDLLTSLTTTG